MGVQGLWSVLHCTGRDIDLSSLEGKVLAIDLSIWLNQALKSGNESPNIHLEILFRRICKLLFYNIKPVFVFDGPSPSLKKETIVIRRKQRQMLQAKSEKIKSNIINLLMKKKITQKRKSNEVKVETNDIFKLPENEYFDSMLMNTNDMDSGFSDIAHDYLINLPSNEEINFESESFLSMPYEVQHEVIRYIAKEKRYGYDTNKSTYNQKTGQDFSQLQIQKLLSRNVLQHKVENLRTSMNYQNNQNLINSLGCKEMNKLLPNQVHSKKILSHKEAYLMMIDPSETDLVESLTRLKRQYMFKNINLHKELPEPSINEEKEKELTEKNNSSNSEDHDFQAKDKIEKLNVESLTNCDLKENEKNLNTTFIFQPLSTNDCDGISTEYKEIFDDKFDNVETGQEIKVHEPDIGGNRDCKNVDNRKCEDEKDSDPRYLDETKEYSSYDGLSMLTNVTNDNCEYLPTSFVTLGDEIKLENDPVCKLFSCSESPGNNFSSIDEDKIEDVLNKPFTDNEITQENYEELHAANESDDDFIDVPEMKLDNEEEDMETNELSDADIAMILSDPNKWEQQIDETIDILEKEERKIESQAASISERYYEEAKELLRLFGIPYVESPAEAEAQCVFLEHVKLTDGTITEDSDIWLFGGRMVYKHVFSRDQSVRAYSEEFIHDKLGLSRDLMICIALLSGSDYAPGIHGIGPVIAMEILAEFSDPDVDQTHFQVLECFKNWHNRYSNDITKCSDNSDRKRFLRFSLDHNFLNSKVIEAYHRPLVNESTEPFIWSQPSIDKLLEFGQTKIGWGKLKVLEMLNIVINRKASSLKTTKRTILDYFTDSAVEQLLSSKKSPSKRLKLATNHRNFVLTKTSRLNK